MRTQRSSSSGGRVRNIRRRRQRVGDGVPATHGTRRQPATGTRNRPSPTSSRRTRRAFRNRAVRQTAVRHQAAHSVRNQEPTVADEQLSNSSDVSEPRSASDGGTAPGDNQRPEARTDSRRRVVVVLVGRSGTAPCVRRRRRNHRNSNVFSCRPIAAATGCRPAAAPGTAQRPPARTRVSETRNSDTFLLVRCLSVNCQLVSQVTAPDFSRRARRRKPR